MDWQILSDGQDLDSLDSASFERPQLIFKHSTRCSLSAMAFSRLDACAISGLPFHILDLIRYKPLSNAIAERYDVVHESPQVLLIHRGECITEASHLEITPALIAEEYGKRVAAQ